VTPVPARMAAVVAAFGVAACAHTPPPASQETISAYVSEAHKLAGDDLKPLLALCNPAPAARPPQAAVDKFLATQMARPAPEPGRAFDNLYYIGAAWVSAWAIKTSQGVILIDALDNATEAEQLIDGGMRRLGLDPSTVKYILVTHAHGDHYGGVDYLVSRYHPSVVMSEVDWQQTEEKLEFDSQHWGRPPKDDPGRDLRVKDGDKLALGDVSVTLNVTPGHTHGTISPTFDVRDGGRTHRVLLWGGTAFNFGNDIPRLQSYIDATERMARIAKAEGIDVMISNHAGYDGAIDKLAALRKGAASNPFVIGNDAVVRGLQVMGACGKAQRDRYLLEK